MYDDKYIIRKYCENLDIKFDDYLPLLAATDDLTPIQALLQYDLFKDYQKMFEKKQQPEPLKRQQKELNHLPKEIQRKLKKENQTLSESQFQALLIAETEKLKQAHQKDLQRAFINFLKDIEKEKLYYFALALANPQKVLVVKSPADTNERKKFLGLGYEWSSAKGNEGIKYLGATYQSIETEPQDEDDSRVLQNLSARRVLNTPLFDSIHRQNPDKIAYYIQKNFILKKRYIYIAKQDIHLRDYFNEKTEPLPLPEHLQPFATYANMYDLLDFTRTEFNKAISLTPKKTTLIDTQWEMVRIQNLLEKIEGSIAKVAENEIKETGKYPVVTQESDKIISGYTDIDEPITDLPVIIFGDHTCVFKYVDFPFLRGADGTQLIKVNSSIILPKYFFYATTLLEIPNREKYERRFKYLEALKIPLPPREVQKR